MEWFRLYNEFASDPKVQQMTEAMQRRLVMVFCLRAAGHLPGLTDDELRHALGISERELETTKKLFVAKGFVNEDWEVTNWDHRQKPSDSSASRTKDYRDRKKRGDSGVTSQRRHSDALEETRGEEKSVCVAPAPACAREGQDAADWQEAMAEAGFRQRSITVPDDPQDAARRLLRHFQGERLEALIWALSEGLKGN